MHKDNWKGIDLVINKRFRVLLIEGHSSNNSRFSEDLEKRGVNLSKVENGTAGLRLIKEQPLPHAIIINAASLRTSGIRICSTFKSMLPDVPIILITDEESKLEKYVDASVVLSLPFTVQKLINRLQLYQPAEDKLLYILGPLVLNTNTNYVTCNGHDAQLTPRLSTLLQYLMDRPNMIVDRETLFKEVWATDYLGDTRTLDVHISWLRQAIEDNPGSPKVIQTVRSKGYMLVI